MVNIKLIKETEKIYKHYNVFNGSDYLGYIIKSTPSEKNGWWFVNDSKIVELTDKSKGYNQSMFASTKQKLIDSIDTILIGLDAINQFPQTLTELK